MSDHGRRWQELLDGAEVGAVATAGGDVEEG
jgi:hypothetical protein